MGNLTLRIDDKLKASVSWCAIEIFRSDLLLESLMPKPIKP